MLLNITMITQTHKYGIILFLAVILIYSILTKYEYKIFDGFANEAKGLDSMDGIVYINLDNRDDRKQLILKELELMGAPPNKIQRVAGVYIPKNGHKGCVQGHIIALRLALMNNWRQIAIFEDDAEISTKSPDEFKEQLSGALDELTRIGKWDILLLATANKQETSLPDKKYISRVTGSTTSSGYIIKSHYYEKLLGLFEYINTMMEKDKWTAGGHEPWALDQKWIDLQKLDAWYCCKSDIIKQRASKSTINNRE